MILKEKTTIGVRLKWLIFVAIIRLLIEVFGLAMTEDERVSNTG